MATDQTRRPTAATASRLFSVVRQALPDVSATWFGPLLPAGDDGLRRRRRGRHALDHGGAIGRRRNHPEPVGGETLDAGRRSKRVDLEPQVSIDFVLGGALL